MCKFVWEFEINLNLNLETVASLSSGNSLEVILISTFIVSMPCISQKKCFVFKLSCTKIASEFLLNSQLTVWTLRSRDWEVFKSFWHANFITANFRQNDIIIDSLLKWYVLEICTRKVKWYVNVSEEEKINNKIVSQLWYTERTNALSREPQNKRNRDIILL